ncbi:pisatin demethylase [Verticillium dahliae VdLs.17]|uniref:Pisatin demethylase n=1 Tax=Verticillium dahliae (strain VdLs.17 / ATCC MYA-4575 / FGSC 10137) TaxID=498257 RepID=G2WX51_VERDV|nr:pisatin demethylase [Verticillium dahliae VdLs.17]EGY21306.1 pisatin demethylase [Verticillium dahliae VdLs.17]
MNSTPETTDGPMIPAWSTASSLRDSLTCGLSSLLVTPAVAFFAITADYAPRIGRLHENTDGKWKKLTDLCKISSSVTEGKITHHMFSQVDNIFHTRLKRPVVCHYSVPSMLAMEPHMNEVVETFCDHLQKRFVYPGTLCDLDEWQAYCKMRRMPWLDHCLDKNLFYALGPPIISYVTKIAIEALTARLPGEHAACTNENPDFLQYFIESKTSHPEIVDESTIIGHLLLNHQRVWKRLESIIREHVSPNTTCSHATARALPYLEATVRETLRCHPAVSMGLKRIVPEGGLVLPYGTVVPAGTFVGINIYIVGRNKGIFGADADEFRPDRWLQGENEWRGLQGKDAALERGELGLWSGLPYLPRMTSQPHGGAQSRALCHFEV